MFGALFVRRGWGGYYFGDYFAPRYNTLGFNAWCGTVGPGGGFAIGFGVGRTWGYDPLWSYYSVAHRNDRAWGNGFNNLYDGRYRGTIAAPPRTLVQQNTVINNITNVNVKNVTNNVTVNNKNVTVNNKNVTEVAMVAPLKVAKDLQPEAKVQAISAQVRKEEGQQAKQIRDVGVQRTKLENAAVAKGPVAKKGDAPQSLKLDVPKNITARGQVIDEKKGPPPNPHVNAKVEPKGKIDPKIDPKGKFDPKFDPKIDPKGKIDPKIDPKGKFDPKIDPKIDPKGKFDPKVDPKGKVDPKLPTLPEPKPKVDPKTLPKVDPKLDPKGKVDPKVDPKGKIDPKKEKDKDKDKDKDPPKVDPKPPGPPPMVRRTPTIPNPVPPARPLVNPPAATQPAKLPKLPAQPKPIVVPKQPLNPQPVTLPKSHVNPKPVVQPKLPAAPRVVTPKAPVTKPKPPVKTPPRKKGEE